MPKSRKKIETFEIQINSESEFLFENILTSEYVVEREFAIKGKHVELNILENKRTYLIGLVITSRRDNVPPKTNRTKKTMKKLGLDDGEGLGYANIFIYEKKRRILMYEVNKNGCYIDHFIEYIYKSTRTEGCEYDSFDIKVTPILTAKSYHRIMNMSSYKSFELQLAYPSEIISSYRHKNDALLSAMENAQQMHSDRAFLKYEVNLKGKAKHEHKSLANMPVRELIDKAQEFLLGPFKKNVEKIVVKGYEDDPENSRVAIVDLVSDRYLKEIILDEPQENIDLLQSQRTKQIIDLYTSCKTDFDEIFRKV